MKQISIAVLSALVLATSITTLQAQNNLQSPMFIINEDNDHYFKKPKEVMTEKDLRAYIDTFANTKVTHFFMCPNGQRTSYRSSVHEAIWDDINGKPPDNIWCTNCKILFDKGIDPYQLWIDQCRKQKISPWITMRMNDVHFSSIPNYFRSTNFWRERRDLWRDPNTNSNDWMMCAFDYSKKDAYNYHLDLVKELFERYDFDGFETDWLRFPWHLTPGKAKEQGPILTRFMRDLHTIANEWAIKRGHPIKISARISADPDAASGLGTDAVSWARKGLVDMLVPSCFFSTSDFDIPIELWQKRLGKLAETIPIIPGTDNGTAAYPGAPRLENTLALYYGWAASARYRGAESFYLFNLVYLPLDKPELHSILEEGLEQEVLMKNLRRHPLTYRDAIPKGFSNGSQLPQTTDKAISFTIQTGKRPATGTATVIIGLADKPGVKEATFTASLNNTAATTCTNATKAKKYGGKTTVRAIRYGMPITALRDGANTVMLKAKSGTPQQVTWAEIEIAP